MKTSQLKSEDVGLPSLTMTDWTIGSGMDGIFFTAFIAVIITPNERLPAFRMGLIDKMGRVIKEPSTRDERRALSYVTRIALEMKTYARARTRMLYIVYRQERRNPFFIRSVARTIGMRHGRYFGILKPTVDGGIYN